ncbi:MULTISPECIES: protein-export chaperone SecB [unclassified Rhodosalinus]|uniref:protein-export chaperone SecB n=1 Tax=unclassified Rhodosalinus TaxID=2630183 RepID=UPI0035250AF6
MAETENGAGGAGQADQQSAQQQGQQPVKMSVLAQYVRDMSFENILVQKGARSEGQPDIQVKVNLDARKREAENQYEVIIKLSITSASKETGDPLFLMEIDYAGVFHVENVAREQLHPYLMIECPRMLFPYLRRIVSDVSRDGGFPPLNLENIDFLQLYRNELVRLQAEQKQQTDEAGAPPRADA